MTNKITGAFTACSDPLSKKCDSLALRMEELGVPIKMGRYLYSEASARDKAEELNDFFFFFCISEIFDLSGGDLAVTLVPYLDFESIARSKARFWGYSDLTAIINAIYTKTGRVSSLYHLPNISLINKDRLSAFIKGENLSFADFPVKLIKGSGMKGVLVGGNIRCLLKLAGTDNFPDMSKKILVIESYSAGKRQVYSMLSQLALMGVFDRCAGVVIGSFTKLEKTDPGVYEYISGIISSFNAKLPIAVTSFIGHGIDAHPIQIGREYEITPEGAVVITYE